MPDNRVCGFEFYPGELFIEIFGTKKYLTIVMVKVSVAMITYNHEQFITEAVSSVLNQETDFEYEIVIGDDCSTDGTRNLLLELQEKYPEKIKLHQRSENLGMLRNFASVLSDCQGTYIALLEGDDYWTDTKKLQKQVDYLDSHPGCAISFHDVMKLRDNGIFEPWTPAIEKKESYSIEDLFAGNFIPTCSVVFRAGLFEEFPDWYYKAALGDWTLHVLNAQHGDIGYLDDIMGVYRIHSGGTWSSRKNVQNIKDMIEAAELMKSSLNPEHILLLENSISKLERTLCQQLLTNGNFGPAIKFAFQVVKKNPHLKAAEYWLWIKSFARGCGHWLLSSLDRKKLVLL